MTLYPLQVLSTDSIVRGIRRVASGATRLESTSLVFTYGGADIHFTHTQSSGGFDILASDFNYTFLLLILLSLAVATKVLQVLYNRKLINRAWA